jgi:glucokinase
MSSGAQKNLFVGVDVGGTKVAAGLVNAEGEILSHIRVPMAANSSPEEGLQSVLSAIKQALPENQGAVAGIGICAPGPLDPRTGVILNPPNVPCWRNFSLAEAVRKVHSVPVKVDNDANAAALAETRWGAARGRTNVFYATIGTGIGTGIVFEGKIYHGRTGSAGEGGHVSIDYNGPICRCGKPGCIEILASGPAIARRAREEVNKGRTSSMLEIAGGSLAAITGEIVGKASENGDSLARAILSETTTMLALWLSNMVDLFDPEIIVIGGGAAALLSPFFDDLRAQVTELAVNPWTKEVPIIEARYGAESGIAGGAALCA